MKLIMIFACALLLTSCTGPLGPIAGGTLRGEVFDVPPTWDIVHGVEHVQLETINNGKPRSVLIWVGTADERLYVATSLISGSSNPKDRTWVKNVITNPNVRLLIQDRVYRLEAHRELDPARMAAARAAMMLKYEVEADEQSNAAWIFELRER